MLKTKPKKLDRFEKIVLVINAIAAAALLPCYLAPYINPDSFWPIAFFGMAYLQLLCVNAAFLVFWIIRLRWLALISVICILIGAPLMGRNIGFRKQSFASSKTSAGLIRMMTYNVHIFQKEKEESVHINNDILQIIKNEQPDLINMQEYFARRGEPVSMSDAVKTAMQAGYYWFKPVKITPYDSTGLAIFSKYPIIKQDTIPAITDVEIEGIFADVQRGTQVFRIYNLHLQSTNFSRADNTYLQKAKKPNLHETKQIGGKLKRAFISRAEQVIVIKQLFNKCPYPYIVTGDFNDTPLSFSVNYLQDSLKNAFREKGYGFGVTFYGEYPGFQLDYIMVSPQFNVTDYKIIRERLSDHYPVISDLELK